MIASGNFGPLSKAHNQNFKNAVQDMEAGVSPVVIDNTNIKANEAKNYVEAALKMGYDENTISFIEVGDGGISAEELADRNTHGVPLEKIEQMLQSYNSVGPMSVEKAIKAKAMYSNKPKMIAMLVLDDVSKKKLIEATKQYIPEGWNLYAHHMTISFGKGIPDNLSDDLGTTQSLRAVQIGISDMAVAVGVEGYHSDNKNPHITLGVNPNGGKPKDSNLIKDWSNISNINLKGVIFEQHLK